MSRSGTARIETYPPVLDAAPRPSLAEEVAEYLRRLILTGGLRPTERIDQEAVAAALDVSRSPVREALVVLDREGLVALHRNRGAAVADITPDDIVEHYELFGIVSGRAAAFAAERLSDAELDQLAGVHDRFARGDGRAMTAANHEFHRLINLAAPPRTRWLLAMLARAVPPDYYEFAADAYPAAVADHAAILDAIVARDADAARRAMEAHLRSGGLAAADALHRQGFWSD